MILLTENLGLVKVSVHAIERMRERFGINKKAVARRFRKILTEGDMIKHSLFVNQDNVMVLGQYILVMTKTNCGRYKVITVLNNDSHKPEEKEYRWR